MIRVVCSLSLMFVSTIAFAQFKLPTVDEALKISAETGKPIFAMAGQET